MKRIIFIALAASVLLSACSKEEGKEENPGGPELTFPEASIGTKASAGYSDYFDDFKVYLSGTGYTAVTSTFSYNSGTTSWSGTPAIYLGPATASIVAWAPASLSCKVASAPTVFALTPQLYTASSAELVHMTSTNVSASDASKSVKLDRAYSQITFKLTTTNYPGAADFTAFTLHGTPGSTSTIDIADGTVTAGTTADLSLTAGLVSSKIPDTGISVLVVPMETAFTAGDLKVSCTIDGVSYSNLAISDITMLERAKNYEVNMSLSGTVLTITSVEIQNWIDVQDAGNVTVIQ